MVDGPSFSPEKSLKLVSGFAFPLSFARPRRCRPMDLEAGISPFVRGRVSFEHPDYLAHQRRRSGEVATGASLYTGWRDLGNTDKSPEADRDAL